MKLWTKDNMVWQKSPQQSASSLILLYNLFRTSSMSPYGAASLQNESSWGNTSSTANYLQNNPPFVKFGAAKTFRYVSLKKISCKL